MMSTGPKPTAQATFIPFISAPAFVGQGVTSQSPERRLCVSTLPLPTSSQQICPMSKIIVDIVALVASFCNTKRIPFEVLNGNQPLGTAESVERGQIWSDLGGYAWFPRLSWPPIPFVIAERRTHAEIVPQPRPPTLLFPHPLSGGLASASLDYFSKEEWLKRQGDQRRSEWWGEIGLNKQARARFTRGAKRRLLSMKWFKAKLKPWLQYRLGPVWKGSTQGIAFRLDGQLALLCLQRNPRRGGRNAHFVGRGEFGSVWELKTTI